MYLAGFVKLNSQHTPISMSHNEYGQKYIKASATSRLTSTAGVLMTGYFLCLVLDCETGFGLIINLVTS